VTYRLESAQSNASRQLNYTLSTQLAQASPWLGYGGTVQSQELNASIGTQGQLWTIMVSHGIPALVLFLLWFLWCFWVSWRRPPPWADARAVFWSHIVLFSAFSMLVYYEWLPYGFAVVFIAAGLVWREIRPVDGRTPAKPAPELAPGRN
jgi:O-antigen ligase